MCWKTLVERWWNKHYGTREFLFFFGFRPMPILTSNLVVFHFHGFTPEDDYATL
jgi:hypothetical protein